MCETEHNYIPGIECEIYEIVWWKRMLSVYGRTPSKGSIVFNVFFYFVGMRTGRKVPPSTLSSITPIFMSFWIDNYIDKTMY